MYGGSASVSQTTYPALQACPIAVFIKTKAATDNDDPIDQLGLWAAGWHKRMRALWWSLSLERKAEGEEDVPYLRLPTIALIQAVGHDWNLYFACDQGSRVVLYGPIRIGSTDRLLSMYVLLASLQAIKEWIETEFRSEMEAWFGYGAVDGTRDCEAG